MRKTLTSLAVLATLLLAAVSYSSAESSAAKATLGAPAPAFTLQDQDGKPVSLSEFKSKIVVLEWFNNQCPFVQAHYESGSMNAVASKYAAKDVIWLAINSTHDKTNADNKRVAGDWKMQRPILNDAAGATGHLYGATNTPHMYIVDKSGTLVYMGAIDNNRDGDKGSGKINYVAKALDELLAGKSVSEPQTKPYGCTVKYAE